MKNALCILLLITLFHQFSAVDFSVAPRLDEYCGFSQGAGYEDRAAFERQKVLLTAFEKLARDVELLR